MLNRFQLTLKPEHSPSNLPGEYISLDDFLRVSEAIMHSGAPVTADAIECLRPLTTAIPDPKISRELMNLLADRFSHHLKEKPEVKSIVINLDEISRPAACIIASFLADTSFFKHIKLCYTETNYKVDGEDLEEKLKLENFWTEVYNYRSKLIVVPNLPGRYDASLPKSIFICGGLDFGRVIHLAAMWEPKDIVLCRPGVAETENNKALIWNEDSLVTSVHSVERMDLNGLFNALDAWSSKTRNEAVQPLLICGGWKLQAVAACLWATENGRVPSFVCAPDFISKDVERSPIVKWDVAIVDKSIWA